VSSWEQLHKGCCCYCGGGDGCEVLHVEERRDETRRGRGKASGNLLAMAGGGGRGVEAGRSGAPAAAGAQPGSGSAS
jgi:hypothetical protein